MWRRAGDAGHSAALVKIGDYHYYGMATPPDLAAAVQNYRLAADSREAQAMFNLGWMHECVTNQSYHSLKAAFVAYLHT
jgi:TPR repeat protein